jgi:hypothetical protein
MDSYRCSWALQRDNPRAYSCQSADTCCSEEAAQLSEIHLPADLTCHLQMFGPQMKEGVTSRLLTALQRTFDTQYALPHYVINVTATAAQGAAVQYVTPNGEA